MAYSWTDAQLLAIGTTDKALLVSAAAGSGKTATLTERIIRRITDENIHADISKMLIVTFTRSAAADLKTKIFAALSKALAKEPDNTHLASQLMKIGSAKICTIDSFYLDVVRSNFSSLGLSANFRIADESEYDLLAKRVMCECIDELYEKEPNFPTFAECFASVRSSGRLYEIFLALHSDLSYVPEGIDHIKECAERTESESELDFFATSYGNIQRKNAYDVFEHYYGIFKAAIDYMQTDEPMQKSYGASFAYDLDYCDRLRNAVLDEKNGYSETKALLEGYSAIPLKKLSKENASERSIAFKDMRTAFSKNLSALRQKSFSKSAEDILRAMKDTAENLHILYKLLSLFEKNITDEKSRLSLMTFSDVSRATMNLLVAPDGSPTELAKQYSKQFSDIYIDEYQDVDMLQDRIFKSISTPHNRFMVGDIKQSIYSFRGAEPKLFSEYRRAFPSLTSDDGKNSDCATIFMSNNFRCDENVIKFTNHVCSLIFSACSDSIGYTKDDDLVFTKEYTELDENYTYPKVKLAIVTKSENEAEEAPALSNSEREAEYIASEISRLISNEKKADGKPILPGDIAVLFRSKRISPIISEALAKRGILTSEADAERYFEDPDVLMMLCILNVIDNPQRDIYLAGALRSPIFNFTMDELICIRTFADSGSSLFMALKKYAAHDDSSLAQKCRDFLSTLEAWQNDAASLAVDRFIRTLYESDRFIASGLVSQTNNKGEGGNLLMLYEYARKFENGSFKGLYQFIEYLNSVIEEGGKLSSDSRGASSDRVSLMTIHKSKGLEFPVCFVVNAGSSVRSNENRESLVFDAHAGVALKIADGSGLARINTPMREAILASKANDHMEEEMRVLYVALTRARERLYITASAKKDPNSLFASAKASSDFCDRYTIMNKCSSYLDWILLATSKAPTDSCEIDILPYDSIQPSAESQAVGEKKDIAEDKALTERLKREFAFEYKYAPLKKVPSKLSVSKLYPDILDDNDTTATDFPEKVQDKKEKQKKAEVPEFFSGIASKPTSAERGTATHLFLQFCDFNRAGKLGVEEELSRLLEEKFLPLSASQLVYREELEAFMSSELFKVILASNRIVREQRFNVELTLDGFNVGDELRDLMGEDKLAVQGVIDLITVGEDGSVSLFDYKTDRLSRAELENDELAKKTMNERHGNQLSYYAKAAELLFGRKCSRVCVYSTHSAKLYEIAPQF